MATYRQKGVLSMGKKQYRVNVYDGNDVVARVRYNQDLDYWNGRNWQNGGLGLHKGITKLRDGRFVLIHGTDWQGERDWAEIVSPEQALQEILRSGNTELLNKKKFVELKKLYEEKYLLEDEDDLEEIG